MTQPANILSALALLLAVVVAVRGELLRRQQAAEQRATEHQQRLLRVRGMIPRLIVGAMQAEFRAAFEALEDPHGEDLVRPITAETADVSVPTPAAAAQEAFPRERGHGNLPT